MQSDKVSWFPPGHPKAIPVVAAAKVRENITNHNTSEKESDREMVMTPYHSSSLSCGKSFQVLKSIVFSKGCDNERTDADSTKKLHHFVEQREKQQEERNKSKGKGRVKFNDLDPMDPASYSDIPRFLTTFNVHDKILINKIL